MEANGMKRAALADLSPRVRQLIERAPDAATRREQVKDEADKLRRREWWAAQWRAVDAAADVANNPDRYEAIEAGRAALADAGLFASGTADRLPAFADRDAAQRWAWHRRRALLTLFADAAEPAELSAAYRRAQRYLTVYGIEAPAIKPKDGRGTLAGCVRRVTDDKWLTRRGQVAANRAGEHRQINLGRVHKRAGYAVSDAAVAAMREARARSALALTQMELVNEDTGETLACDAVAARSISNPKIRRGELMARIRGLEELANDAGVRCLFVTWTLASRYHARLAADGSPNPKHDIQLNPRHGQAALTKQWARVRARLAKRGLKVSGFRAAEPHHDGCPHWHLWLFVAGSARDLVTVRSEIRREALREDGSEPGATKRRATFKTLRAGAGGGPAAYAAKYVSKSIDGGTEAGDGIGHAQTVEADGSITRHPSAASHAERIIAWSRNWGIRQFQFFGVQAVGPYREARRLRDPLQGELELMEPARAAADAGQFAPFARAARAVGLGLAREPGPEAAGMDGGFCVLSQYGESKPARVHALEAGGVLAITRPHRWRRQWRKAGPDAGRAAGATAGRALARAVELPPWTRGNNCNPGPTSPPNE